MPIKLDVGGLVYSRGLAAASLNFTPLYDRAALLRRLSLANESAADTWDLTIGGRVVSSFRQFNGGNQKLLQVGTATKLPQYDFFQYCRDQLDIDPAFPGPIGLTATLASRGGATADILAELVEHDPGDFGAPGLNDFRGTDFLIPVSWALAASVSAAGPTQVDTQYAPAWFPPLFNNTPLSPGWQIEILALFMEGVGVNTYSGAANHQDTTQAWHFLKNGTELFTRAGQGIPNRGSASAAGSANTVYSQEDSIFPPLLFSSFDGENNLAVPITLRQGDAFQIMEEFQGDFTGGASYLGSILNAICRVHVPSGAGLM